MAAQRGGLVGPNQRGSAARKGNSMAKRTSKGQRKIYKMMKERKAGTLVSTTGKKVTSRKQAVAIALSEARKSGAKIPKKES